jgi:dTDP-4-amino-4,6-dideoxygalactose transaminase
MEKRFSAAQVLLTTSCTSALEMAAMLCDIAPGDEVVLPSYTFVSTANAFLLRGARLRFVDIRPDTLNLDETCLEQAMTERTVAVVPVHYAGVACEMDAIIEIARQYGAYVIEDAAQGVNARYKGVYLGAIGNMGAYSFHETKNFICGEGGAFVSGRPEFIERAEIIREKGTNRSKFFRGEVEKYTWVDIGSSYLPSDMLAAFLYAQLEHMDEITAKRKKIYDTYYDGLEPLASQGLITLPTIPAHCEPNYHMCYMLVSDHETRSELLAHLNQRDINAIFHYVPLHTSPVGQDMGYKAGMLPVTESVSERLIRLPFFYELTESEVTRVVETIHSFFKTAHRVVCRSQAVTSG